MADIKKVTGYKAPDGSHHDTLKKAMDHTVAVKIKEALKTFADELDVPLDSDCNARVIFQANLADFLFDNRVALLAALNQEIVKRAPRKSRAKPAVKLTNPA